MVIHPFSFPEALAHAGLTLPDDAGMLSSRRRSQMERRFLDYLSTGGFPEAQGLDFAQGEGIATFARFITFDVA